MRAAHLLLAFRAAVLTALFASSALVIEYAEGGDPAFCGIQSACYKVRMSEVGRGIAQRLLDTFGAPVTLPQVAVVLFCGLLVFSFFARSKASVQALAAFSTVGALAALGLLGVQISIKELCFFCVIVDVSMVVAAATSLALLSATTEKGDELHPSTELPVTGRWVVAATLVGVIPFVWSRYPVIPPLPPEIEAMQVEGKLTIVSMTDFECPFCRKLYPTLSEVKKRDDVVFKRLMVPLDGHPGAMPAALAYLCTAEDRREELVEHLYTARNEELTVPQLLSKARQLGFDARRMEDCMADAGTAAQVEADKAIFKASGARGLPTTFVGRYPVLGYNPDKLKAAVARPGSLPELPVWSMVVAAVAVLAWAGVSTRRVLLAASQGQTGAKGATPEPPSSPANTDSVLSSKAPKEQAGDQAAPEKDE